MQGKWYWRYLRNKKINRSSVCLSNPPRWGTRVLARVLLGWKVARIREHRP
jgi:hypothetical protein